MSDDATVIGETSNKGKQNKTMSVKVYAGAQSAYDKAIRSIDEHIAAGLAMPQSVAAKSLKGIEAAYLIGLRRKHSDATVEGYKAVLSALTAKLAECDLRAKPVKDYDGFAVSLAGLTADAVADATVQSELRAEGEGDEGDA